MSRSATRSRLHAFGLVLVATFAVFCSGPRIEDPRLGSITLEKRWGNVQAIEIDFNRDGSVDFRAEYPPSAGDVSHHDPFAEHWQSSRCDGFFDVHVRYTPAGEVDLIERDTDRDGHYEATEYDQALREFLAKPQCPRTSLPARE